MTPLSPHQLLSAYANGIFPMAHDDGIYWYDPDPRTIIPLDRFHVPRRLARTMRTSGFDIKIDRDFRGVMEGCAEIMPGRDSTWISEEIIEAYVYLHRRGFAHSVEAWDGDRLVGGLYGVTLGGLFAGESMFSRERDASKMCLVHLVEHLRERGFRVLDTQFNTPHLKKFGAIDISREAYKRLLGRALQVEPRF